ncbi:MAG: hypothetical protein ABI645_16640 [Pseudomonadota bacterium]
MQAAPPCTFIDRYEQPGHDASVCTGDVGLLHLSKTRDEASFAIRGGRAALTASVGSGTPVVARAAPLAPIALVRNGREFHITCSQSTVRAGTEIKVMTERPVVTLGVSEMNLESWVIFELPGFTRAASGTQQGSMAALRSASETSYFRGEDALWVKLVMTEAPVMPIHPLNLQAAKVVSR